MHRLTRSACLPAAFALVLWTTGAILSAQSYTVLYSFHESDGCCPDYPSILAQGPDGNIYGTSTWGGYYGYGNAFVLTPNGALTPIYDFNIKSGAPALPDGGLNLGFDGNLYGTTYQGGSGAGTVFRITTAGVLTVLHDFSNGADGGYPRTPPTQAPDGNLYGVTGNGTIAVLYKITPTGAFSVVMNMPSMSHSPLIVGSDRMLYGITDYGGTYNRGTAFQFNPATKKLKIIHSFEMTTGAIPTGALMQAKDGKLYGTAVWGGTMSGGVIFQMTTAGTYAVIYNFNASSSVNGTDPNGGVVQGSDGFLYGATVSGGAFGLGTLFKVNTKGAAYAVLHDFDTSTGDTPASTPLLHTNGTLYGVTQHGGTYTVYGAVYSTLAGLKPFAAPFVFASGKVGDTIQILGDGLLSATSVKFGNGAAAFAAVSDGLINATIEAGATTGSITVDEPGGKRISPNTFKVLPTISSFSPQSGPVGTQVVITGTSLLQTKTVLIGKAHATFTVDSDTQITATVAAGAVTGKVVVTTAGGSFTAVGTYTVH
jgi:uncharacterized repeat protein (TIGR03803 family)